MMLLMKQCSMCQTQKPLSDFNKKSSKRDGLRAECKECQRNNYRNYFQENREKVLSANRERAAASPEKAIERHRAWAIKNPERLSERLRRWAIKNPNKVALKDAKWRTENRDKIASKSARRRAQKFKATPTWADLKKIDVVYAEAARISEETGVLHHVDHAVPLKSNLVCGLHCEFNLQILPGAENIGKSNRFWPDMP